MKLLLALVITGFILSASVHATPSHINNQEQARGSDDVVSVAVTEEPQTVQATANEEQPIVQEPSPQPQTVQSETEQPPVDYEAEAKAFIYFKESSNNPLAKNAQGCFGLGQDCNGIVEERCGGDYACQDTFFTEYMLRRYGTWQAAKSFWLSRVPINGRDVGNWW